jgi:antitoxin component YwqK of YwqJK toxin-antitoxin module
MKKVILIWASFFFISCNNLENCEVEIINGLVYKDNVLYTGKCAYYDYNTGNMVSSHEYNKGKFHGKWKFYFENGQLETVGNFDNGLRIGKWNYYYQNGEKSQISVYLNGKKHGIWKVFDQDGKITSEHEWKDGVAIIDTTKSDNTELDIKIPGYKVTPITKEPNSD